MSKKETKSFKKLIRPLEDRKIAGVAGAFANYFNIDVVLVRVILVLLLIPGGFPGLLAYLLSWIVIPSEE